MDVTSDLQSTVTLGDNASYLEGLISVILEKVEKILKDVAPSQGQHYSDSEHLSSLKFWRNTTIFYHKPFYLAGGGVKGLH